MQMTGSSAAALPDPDAVALPIPGASPALPGAEADPTVLAAGVHGVPLTVSAPEGAMRGGVIVVQEIYGVNDHIAAATRKLAAQGYLAVAPHLYHRVAEAPVDTYQAAQPMVRSLTGAGLRHDLDDALEFLTAAGVDGDRIGILGFSMGGTVALWAASTLPVAAAVSFYGAGITRSRWPGVPAGLESGARLRAPWLGLYGDKDTSIPVEEVEALRSTFGSSGVAATIVRYPDAGHAFASDPASPKHRAGAAADAWNRTLSWFDAHLR